MGKKKKIKNGGINMDQILGELEHLKNDLESRNADSNTDDIEEKIRRIVKNELGNMKAHRTAADEISAVKTNRNEEVSVENTLAAILNLIKEIYRRLNSNDVPRIQSRNNDRWYDDDDRYRRSSRRYDYDDYDDYRGRNRATAYDEFGNPLNVEILDNSNFVEDDFETSAKKFIDKISRRY